MFDLTTEILDDFLEPLKSVPLGIVYGTIIFLAGFFAKKYLIDRYISGTTSGMKNSKGEPVAQASKKRYLQLWLFFVYLSMVAIITFLSREPGSNDSIDMRIFSTWGVNANDHAYVIENVIMLFPLGIFLPVLFEWFRKPWTTVWIGMLLSVTIETMQLITRRGHCQLDDVIANTLGTVLGYICWILFLRYTKKRTTNSDNFCNSKYLKHIIEKIHRNR